MLELSGVRMATIVLGVALLKEVLLGMVLLVLVMMAIAVAVACVGPQDGGDGGSGVGCSRHGGGGKQSAEHGCKREDNLLILQKQPRPSSYPLLGPKYLLLGTIYPQLRVQGRSWRNKN